MFPMLKLLLKTMPSIFTKIINREIPAHIVWENEKFIATMDIRPVNPGHMLVIPKQEIGYIFDMNDSDYSDLMLTAKKLAGPLKMATNAKRVGLVVEGFGVDHVHIHLIPINEANQLDPHRAKEVADEELAIMAEKIKSALQK